VVAAAAAAVPPRRVTRSLSTKKRSAAAAAAQQEPPVAQQGPRTRKKARLSGGPIRSYNLRSKQQQAEQQTTVTPATATRGQATADLGSPAASSTADDDTGINKNNGPTILPAGVVDIFTTRPKACCKSGPLKTKSQGTCYCPPASQAESIQILSSQHLTDYGLEYCRDIEGREKAQVAQLLGRIHVASDDAASSNNNHSNASDSEDDDDDELMDSDDEDAPVRARRALAMERRRAGTTGGSASNNTTTKLTLSPTSSIVDTDPLPRQPLLSARMRKILVQWMSEVAVEYRLSDATYHLSISLLDQLLSMGPTAAEWQLFEDNDDGGYVTDDEEDQPWFMIQRKDFQAIGCACLWLAAKIEEVYPPRNERFVYIADYSFTADKLNHLETRICKLLQYRLQRVTPFHFVYVNLRASQACEAVACPHFLDHTVVKEVTLYLLELSRASYVLSLRKPSLLAAAAMYLARATLGIRAPADQAVEGNEFWTKSLEYYTRYSVKDLTGTALRIHQWHLSAESSPTGVNPVFTKYKAEAHLRVSLKTVPRVEDLGLETEMTHNEDMLIDENKEVSVKKMAL